MLNFAYLVFIATWSLGIAFFIGKRLLLHTLLVSASAGMVYVSDFLRFYTAGQIVLHGQGLHAYDPQLQKSVMDELIAPLRVSQVIYVMFVPFVFVLSLPLAMMPLQTAYLVWIALSSFFIFASAYLMHKFCPRFSRLSQTMTIFLGLFATMANLVCIENGQIGAFSLLMTTGFTVAFLRSKEKQSFLMDLVGGACLALSSVKPHYAIFLALPALARARWRLLIFAALSEVVLLTIAAQAIGWSNVLNYPHIVIEADANTSFGAAVPTHMVCIRGILSFFMADAISLKISMFIMLSAAAALLWIWRKASTAPDRLLYALTLVTMLVLSPHTNLYDCLALGLAAYLVLPSTNLSKLFALRFMPLKWLAVLFALYPIFTAVIYVIFEFVPMFEQNPTPLFIYHLVLMLLLLRLCTVGTADAEMSVDWTGG